VADLLRLARCLVLVVGTFLRRLAMACSVAPTGPNGSRAAAPGCFTQAEPAFSRRLAPGGFVPGGGAATELGNRVGILEKMKDLIGFLR
jgi:hypothetical protein